MPNLKIHAIPHQTEEYRYAIKLLQAYAKSEKVDLYDVLCCAKKGSTLLGLYDTMQLHGCICLFPHPQSLAAFCVLDSTTYINTEQQKRIEELLRVSYPEQAIFLDIKAYVVS